MKNESANSASSLSARQQVELEMLHAVLMDDLTYPWNPYEAAAIAALDEFEQAFNAEDVSAAHCHQALQAAAHLWAQEAPLPLATLLIQKFSDRMPVQLLQQLAASAQAASQQGQAVIDQLVTCAQTVLAGWEADDLRVMARPLAMAMRDGQGEMLDLTLRSIRQSQWETLSEVEQARLSLAIARYALEQASESEV